MIAIIGGGLIAAAHNCWTRHATPIPFCHLLVQGTKGRAVLNAIDPAATGLFVFCHPTLGDWAALPGGALGKQEDGSPLHVFMGVTPADGGAPLSAAAFAGLDIVELYVRGHVRRCTGLAAEDRDGAPYIGLDLADSTLLDSLKPGAIDWQTGDGPLPLKFCAPDGVSPIIDPASLPLVPTDPEATP